MVIVSNGPGLCPFCISKLAMRKSLTLQYWVTLSSTYGAFLRSSMAFFPGSVVLRSFTSSGLTLVFISLSCLLHSSVLYCFLTTDRQAGMSEDASFIDSTTFALNFNLGSPSFCFLIANLKNFSSDVRYEIIVPGLFFFCSNSGLAHCQTAWPWLSVMYVTSSPFGSIDCIIMRICLACCSACNGVRAFPARDCR